MSDNDNKDEKKEKDSSENEKKDRKKEKENKMSTGKMAKYMSMFENDEKNLICESVKAKEKVMTASPSLNWALNGGFYKGYTTMLVGPDGGGKSLISMLAAGALMQSDPEAFVYLISTEFRAPTPERAATLGVDPKRLIIREVNNASDVFDWIVCEEENFTNSDKTKSKGFKWLLKDGAPIKGLIIDSIKGIITARESNLEKVTEDNFSDLSRILNISLRRVLSTLRDFNIMTILIQQVNANMDQNEVKYGNKFLIPSGWALKHFVESYAFVERVDSKESKLLDDEAKSLVGKDKFVQVGQTVRVTMKKANMDRPAREAEFRINYSKGIVDIGLEVVELATKLGVIKHPINPQTGKEIASQYVFGDKKWIGIDNIVEEAENDSMLRRDLMNAIYSLNL